MIRFIITSRLDIFKNLKWLPKTGMSIGGINRVPIKYQICTTDGKINAAIMEIVALIKMPIRIVLLEFSTLDLFL